MRQDHPIGIDSVSQACQLSQPHSSPSTASGVQIILQTSGNDRPIGRPG